MVRMLFLACALLAWQAPDLGALLDRVSEEAGKLARKAPAFISTETLRHRAFFGAPPVGRVGPGPSERFTERVIVSDYTVGPLKGSNSTSLVEFREVVSVNGRKVQPGEGARHALSLGLPSIDDQARKRMLEDFARHLPGAVATDYALMLLYFGSSTRDELLVNLSGQENVGGDDAVVLDWRQQSSGAGELVFAGREASRQRLAGRLWVRKTDGLPLRIWAWAAQRVAGKTVSDEATVDYTMTQHGFVAPASVHHQHFVDRKLTTDNLYTYSQFRLFGTNTEIHFQTQPAQ
jgi:hypothetical protein